MKVVANNQCTMLKQLRFASKLVWSVWQPQTCLRPILSVLVSENTSDFGLLRPYGLHRLLFNLIFAKPAQTVRFCFQCHFQDWYQALSSSLNKSNTPHQMMTEFNRLDLQKDARPYFLAIFVSLLVIFVHAGLEYSEVWISDHADLSIGLQIQRQLRIASVNDSSIRSK